LKTLSSIHTLNDIKEKEMVSFRKLFPVLAVIGLLMATGTASAQVTNCTASALTPLVRVEGLTEPVGRITITCDVATGTAPTLQFNVVSSSVDFTNSITSGSASTKSTTARATIGGSGSTSPVYGVLVNSKEIDFKGIALDAAATLVRVDIDNVRVNASQAAKNSLVNVSITGTAVATGSTQTLLVLNTTKDVASVQQGLNFDVTAGNILSQCNTATAAPTATSDASAVLTFTPGFQYAFRGPTGASQEPADVTNAGTGAPTSGLQLEARFSGVPSGADLYVTRASTNTVTTGTASSATYAGTGSGTFVKLTVATDGTASALWNITSINPADPSSALTFGVVLRQHATGTQIGLGSLQVAGNLAPRSSVASASSTITGTDAPAVPRFTDVTPAYKSLITVNPCRTSLLFPYVISQGGFDTGIALSNTSKDIKIGDNYLFSGNDKALNGQPGTCTLNYFGSTTATNGSTEAQTTAAIAPGAVEVFLLGQASTTDAGISARPGFVGYMIANCNFVNAHGFAFITSGPGGMTMGYNALVLQNRTATGGGTSNGSEALGQ
jgi:hypothetical protein